MKDHGQPMTFALQFWINCRTSFWFSETFFFLFYFVFFFANNFFHVLWTVCFCYAGSQHLCFGRLFLFTLNCENHKTHESNTMSSQSSCNERANTLCLNRLSGDRVYVKRRMKNKFTALINGLWVFERLFIPFVRSVGSSTIKQMFSNHGVWALLWFRIPYSEFLILVYIIYKPLPSQNGRFRWI